MRALVVVLVHIGRNTEPKFPRGIVFTHINIVAFKAAEPSLDNHVINPPGFAVHTLTDAVRFEKGDIIVACELTALIRVDDCRGAVSGYCSA